MMHRRRAIALVWATQLVLALSAAAPQTFDVASVKPAAGSLVQQFRTFPSGRFEARNVTVRQLVSLAYGLPATLIEGGPEWVDSRRFDVTATTATTLPIFLQEAKPGPFHEMLRALLATRFDLQVHRGIAERTVLVLERARQDRYGPGLVPSTVDCSGDVPDDPEKCVRLGGPGGIKAAGVTMDSVALAIEARLGEPVVDQTGLKGSYDVALRWDPNFSAAIAAQPSTPDSVSLTTAVQEQLGLTLKRKRVPIQVVVIDRLGMPSPD